MDYFKKIMGSAWGQAELAKPREEWHVLFSWYAMTCEYQKKVITTPGQPTSAPMTGAACGIGRSLHEAWTRAAVSSLVDAHVGEAQLDAPWYRQISPEQ